MSHARQYLEEVHRVANDLNISEIDLMVQLLVELREQGFSGAAMLPYSELEYGGIIEKLEKLEKKFKLRD